MEFFPDAEFYAQEVELQFANWPPIYQRDAYRFKYGSMPLMSRSISPLKSGSGRAPCDPCDIGLALFRRVRRLPKRDR